jgi:hypothetical protein
LKQFGVGFDQFIPLFQHLVHLVRQVGRTSPIKPRTKIRPEYVSDLGIEITYLEAMKAPFASAWCPREHDLAD